jgi:two-component sensor histidine kinase
MSAPAKAAPSPISSGGQSRENGFPPDGGETGGLIRELDWSRTSLGPISAWPAHLKAAVNLILPARAQIVLFWGADFVALYNDAYAPTIGEKHPRALGRPARENWGELWGDLEPLLRGVFDTGEPVFARDRAFYIERHGYPENVHFDISYSPVRDEAGKVEGVFCIVNETTERVRGEERQRLLLRETNHRLKNLLAMMDAMITMSVRSARTPRELAQALRGRLSALVRAKQLVHPGAIGGEIETDRTSVAALARTILQPYDDGTGERIIVGGPDVPVGANASTALALALHETATNAVKYGALSTPDGCVRVKWQIEGDDFQLEWQETGGPVLSGAPKAKGFGSELTELSITNQLRGRLAHEWRLGGLRMTMTIPLDQLAV